MGGFEMMLKSMGIDPAEMKRNIANFGQIIVGIGTDLATVKKQNAEIIARLQNLDPGFIPAASGGNSASEQNGTSVRITDAR